MEEMKVIEKLDYNDGDQVLQNISDKDYLKREVGVKYGSEFKQNINVEKNLNDISKYT